MSLNYANESYFPPSQAATNFDINQANKSWGVFPNGLGDLHSFLVGEHLLASPPY